MTSSDSRPTRLPLLLGAMCLTACLPCHAAEPGPESAPATSPAVAADGAEAYYQWLVQCTKVVEKQMPAITQSAQAAARAMVQADMAPLFTGTDMIVGEAYGRSGGLMNIDVPDAQNNPAYKGVVVCFLGETDKQVQANIEAMKAFKAKGSIVVLVASSLMREKVDRSRFQADYFIDNGAAQEAWLIRDGQRAIIPTGPVADTVVLWTWTGEFVAACKRLGKMPVIWQSVAMPGAAERNGKLQGKRFHDDKPPAIAPGKLGAAYLAALRADLQMIHRQEMSNIRKAARLAVDARRAGRHAYVFAHGHAIAHAHKSPFDPKYLAHLNKDGVTARTEALSKGDFVLAISYITLFRGPEWGDFVDKARRIGVVPAWSFAGYDPNEQKLIPEGELFIDQHWRKGDAAVAIDGYDVRAFPVSGIIAQSILWMVSAEVYAISSR